MHTGDENSVQETFKSTLDRKSHLLRTSQAVTNNKTNSDYIEQLDFVAEDEEEYKQELLESEKLQANPPLLTQQTLISNATMLHHDVHTDCASGLDEVEEYSMLQMLELTKMQESSLVCTSQTMTSGRKISGREEQTGAVVEDEHSMQQTLESIINHVPPPTSVCPMSEEDQIKVSYRQHLAQKFNFEDDDSVQEKSQYQIHMKKLHASRTPNSHQCLKPVTEDCNSLPLHMALAPVSNTPQGDDDKSSDRGFVATDEGSDELLTKQAYKLVTDLRDYISNI